MAARYRCGLESFSRRGVGSNFLRNAPFLHPSRRNGCHYRNHFYARDPHYANSSAVVIIPTAIPPEPRSFNLIVHFHG